MEKKENTQQPAAAAAATNKTAKATLFLRSTHPDLPIVMQLTDEQRGKMVDDMYRIAIEIALHAYVIHTIREYMLNIFAELSEPQTQSQLKRIKKLRRLYHFVDKIEQGHSDVEEKYRERARRYSEPPLTDPEEQYMESFHAWSWREEAKRELSHMRGVIKAGEMLIAQMDKKRGENTMK